MKKKKMALALLLLATLVAGCDHHEVSSSSGSSSTGGTTSSQPVMQSGEKIKLYAKASYDERAEILGKLESYAMNNNLTGITLYEDGGYAMYNTRIQKGTENYIPNYGFGILTEGNILEELPSSAEPTAAYRKYYHTYEPNDPATINYLNDKGSQVSDLFDYISSSYYGNKMNSTKDGYEWYPILAKEFPIAVDPDEDGYATTWKIKVKTEADGLVYNTLSTHHKDKWANKGVKLEDYVNAFKVLLTKQNGLARGAELSGKSGASSIVGAANYYNSSGNGFNEEAWSKVGIKSDASDNSLTFTLGGPTNRFYAMYYLNSSLYEPLPAEFLTDIGGIKNYGNFTTDLSRSPLDNILSVGPYMLENWTSGQRIVFKRNPSWVQFKEEENKNLYRIEGVHVNILSAAQSDQEAGFREFLAGKLDATSIPSTQLAAYKNDKRTVITNAGTTIKLNVNSCDQETWNSLFGTKGTISQIENESQAWKCKPIMSNDNFLKGVNAAINRKEFAENRGKNPSQDFFGSGYLIDPEKGITYNSTKQHQANLEDRSPETFGFSVEAAKVLFKKAVEEEVAAGHYTYGTKENPTVITLQMGWQAESQITSMANDLVSYIQKCFNDESVCGGKIVLKFDQWFGTIWSDIYYKKMMVGQFDFGFGGVEGNPLDPLNFFEVLKSDNSTGFTLNWGTDTNAVSTELEYDGQYWSFDALWTASDHGVYTKDGKMMPMLTVDGSKAKFSKNSSGDLVVSLPINVPEICKELVSVSNIDLYTDYLVNGESAGYVDLGESSVDVDEKLTTITVTFKATDMGALITYDESGEQVITPTANSSLLSLALASGYLYVDLSYQTEVQKFTYDGMISTALGFTLD